ncbi:MAG: AraC family transcriptional regulator [Chitinophaga sp.]|uniref:helix-turn-helix domain-containing protein n=1 Tax=Chitinophaga sp. TaxID=1869181 RepID=UPI0025C1A5A7|nr:helix-turn-helix domain-containing protein [Chitinophaga sp.]MBV8251390.1 AraC family transcriptional regulator [Chitinophaga sp.]
MFQKYAQDGVIDIDKRLRHKFNFQIQLLEDLIRELEGVVPPNKQAQYCIIYVKKGEGEKSVGNFSFSFKGNTLLIIPKNVIHSTRYWDLECSGYILLFNSDFFLNNAFPKHLIENKNILKRSIRPWLALDLKQQKAVDGIMTMIHTENQSHHKNKSELIAVKILELLIQCDRYFIDADVPAEAVVYHPTIEAFNNLIDQYFSQHRLVGFYANELHIHPNHLNFLVNKYNGKRAKEMIDDKIMQEAKYLLSSTKLSVKELASQLGFENSGYFSSFFRRNAGISPQEYRESIL